MQVKGKPRVLFVMSNDFGELFHAIYFLMASPLDARFLLPPKLFEPNRAGFAYPGRAYETVADVVGMIDETQPDVVLFFTAYLFGINGIFSAYELGLITAHLDRKQIPFATSDPLLGVASRAGPATFPAEHPLRDEFAGNLRSTFELFKDRPHLYIVPPHEPGVTRAMHFFNPTLRLPDSAMSRFKANLLRDAALQRDRPRWLFVLSSEDEQVQTAELGEARFYECWRERISETLRAGRQPVVIAPTQTIQRLQGLSGKDDQTLYFARLGFDLYLHLLLDAEHAFFWNAFSATILARVFNELPTTYFDWGHITHAFNHFKAAALRHYYPRYPLTIRSIDRGLLTASGEIDLRVTKDPALTRIIDPMRAGEPPQRIVERIIGRGPGPA